MGTTSKPIKVLHLIDSGGLYGAEKMLLALCEEQKKQGIESSILSCGELGEAEKPIEAEAKKLGIDVIAWRMEPGLNLRGMSKVLRYIKVRGFTVTHSHSGKFTILLALFPKSSFKAKTVVTVHGYVRPPKYSKLWLTMVVNFFCLQRADARVFVSEGMTHKMPFKLMGKGSFNVIENGISIEIPTESSSKELYYLDEIRKIHPVIGFIGRLSREKGVDILISAFIDIKKKYPDAKLLICGDGYMRSSLDRFVHEHGLDGDVLFLGFLQDVSVILNRVDVFVLPSLTEGMPIVLLEAMRHGGNIVATRVGGIPEMLGQGEAGKLINPGQSSEVTAGILEVLNGGDSTKAMGDLAKKRFSDFYTSYIMAEKYLALYRELGY